MTHAKRLKALIADFGILAPGAVRTQVAAGLEPVESRAETADIEDDVETLPRIDVSPRVGRMWAPIVTPGSGIEGTLVGIEVVRGDSKGSRELEPATARARSWLADAVVAATGLTREAVAERLEALALRLTVGAGGSCADWPGGLTVEGDSWDGACVLAMVSHLLQRAPAGAWVVSAALWGVGQFRGVDGRAEKARIIATETSGRGPVNMLLVDGKMAFADVIASVFCATALGELGALGMTAAALLDLAGAAWRKRDEKVAAEKAQVALTLNPTPLETVMAQLYIASQAIHVGDIEGAEAALGAAENSLPALGTAALTGVADRWFVHEFRVRRAVAECDRLRPASALALLASVDAALEAIPEEWRDARWGDMLVQVRGSQSKALAMSGRLADALVARKEALAVGPKDQRARSKLELAELLARSGNADEAKAALEECRSDLGDIGSAEARQRTQRFLRVARVRAGLEVGGYHAGAAHDIRDWPQPMEVVEQLLATPGGERDARAWFQHHVFKNDEIVNPALRYYFVTSCARAVARGFPEPETWRKGAARLVAGLPDTADAEMRAAALAFSEGGQPEDLLKRAFY